MPSGGGKRVFIDGIDVVEVLATQASTNTALVAANAACIAANTETNVNLASANTATNAALATATAVNDALLQRVTALEANQALVNETALEARVIDLEVDASLPNLPPTPANWSLALFFEGADGELSAAVIAKDSSAGSVIASSVTNYGNARILNIYSGGIHKAMFASRNNFFDPSDARSISTSCVELQNSFINYAPNPRFNMGTEDFAIEADFHSSNNVGTFKVGHASASRMH